MAPRGGMRRLFTSQNILIFLGVLSVVLVILIYNKLLFPGTFTTDSERFYRSDRLENRKDQLHKPDGQPLETPLAGVSELEFSVPEEIDVIITFTKAKDNWQLADKFRRCVASLVKHSSVMLAFHIIGDKDSQQIAEKILKEVDSGTAAKHRVVHLDIDTMAKELHSIVLPMQKYFSYKPGSYYSDSLFFLSAAIHRVVPETMHRVIMLDADLKFREDIAKLYQKFNDFKEHNVIGIAYEGQPVYRHTFWKYRQENPSTRVGDPPPKGLPGFNSGVLLLDLHRMRNSKHYNSLINEQVLEEQTKKYSFKGHLGDQDFFTLISIEHEELFYVLPCNWNRQLCKYWRDKGYESVFDLYFKCEGPIYVYHGNCHTPIPED
ncbi:xyloside xylosyltransferase 1-like [Lingula anatina]|uniref:Xyloside xylosyltransferase 1-like n=1 Tax=Lingula anatina TaxID=7574 RepID=A0A1S3JWL1_LINAN|nr:xyloside xylosyltransferase 1-like [Lingula anatina]|eukprot:XP_013414815.1 xyloside xylosyltransferase 1-like [Lingula anatina]